MPHTLRGLASLNSALSDAVLQTAASCGVCDPEKLEKSKFLKIEAVYSNAFNCTLG